MRKKILLAVTIVIALVVGFGVYKVGLHNIVGIIQYGGQARVGGLAVGDKAPIVPLVTLTEQNEAPLSEWINDKPLVLVFGSFT